MAERAERETLENTTQRLDALFARPYVPALDGLRAFAVLAVLAFHLEDLMGGYPWAQRLALRGWFGVDVFFTLSGFLITWLLLRERSKRGRIAVGRFYVRRLLRLWPAYLLVIGATTTMLLVAGTSLQGTQAVAALPFLLTYTSNFAAAAGVIFPLTLHTWSLAVEEQYYVFYPLLVRALSTERLTAVLGWTIALIAIIRAIGYGWWPLPWPEGGRLTNVVYYLTPLRIDSILAGAFVATLLQRPTVIRWIEEHLFARGRLYAVWAAWIVLIVVVAREDSEWLYIAWLPVLYSLCAVVLLATYLGPPPWLQRVLEIRMLVWIGRISYGVYLTHVAVIAIVRRVVEGRGMPPDLTLALTIGGSIVATLACAALMHRVVEAPFLRLKKRFG